jgi:hypothetical protein
MSRSFIAALAGIAMTLFAWYGPWAWPAWPAFTLIDLIFGSNTAFADLPFAARAATITMLIIVNVAFWGAGVWIVMRAMRGAGRTPTAKP